MSADIDAIISASSAMKEAANIVGDKYKLPYGWLNADFLNTPSYSKKLIEHSEYYKTFYNILEVRTVKNEYLVAMKLVSGRRYKKDLSDIVGIIYEHQKNDEPLDFEKIDKAIIELYGTWVVVEDYTRSVLEKVLKTENLPELFEEQMKMENEAKSAVIEIEQKYPNVVNKNNVNDIIEQARKKKGDQL